MRFIFQRFLVAFVNSKFFRFILFRATLIPKKDSIKIKGIEELAFLGNSFAHIGNNSSQLNQDAWVLFKTNSKSNGYFVEIGACDPIRLSNTYYLESKYGWDGLLVEPNPFLRFELEKSRKARVVSCAAGPRGIIELYVAENPEFTTSSLVKKDARHRLFKDSGRIVQVESIPLTDIFFENNTPKYFDFLSVDVEGSEYQVLSSNDWSKWRPKYVVVEHNFRGDRNRIRGFMLSSGYVVSKENSPYSWDDWFEDVHPRIEL